MEIIPIQMEMVMLLQIISKMVVHLPKSQAIMVMETTIINSTSNKTAMPIIINTVEIMELHSLDKRGLHKSYSCPIISTRTNSFLQMTSICEDFID